MTVLDRIQSYLGNGGLFNPEAMEHEKVRDLIIDAREFIKSQDYQIKKLCETNAKLRSVLRESHDSQSAIADAASTHQQL